LEPVDEYLAIKKGLLFTLLGDKREKGAILSLTSDKWGENGGFVLDINKLRPDLSST